MINLSKIKISSEAKIKKALQVISKGGIQIAFVVDKKDKLIGTLTDGDIRKGFLNGLNINSSIKSIICDNPKVGKKYYSKERLVKIALSNKLNQIPIVDTKGKVLKVFLLNETIKLKKKINKVVIMAGGEGKRLRPYTKSTPKPMLKVGGTPILETIIKKFKDNNFLDITISVNYKSSVIKKYFGDGSKLGVKITYIEETKKMGTVGSLSLIKDKPKEPFFVMNGDLLTNINFDKMLNFHNKHNALATMSIKKKVMRSSYGEVVLNKEKIKSIEEKPTHNFFINAGIYVLDPKCIDYIPKKNFDMISLFKKLISINKKTISFPLIEYWIDVGGLSDFKKANNDFFYNF